jgi:phosphate transport system substrate-binding protein
MRIQFRNWTAAVASIAALTAPMMASASEITGAGATFPAPIYSKWAEAYKAATGVQMNYQAVGSGGGVNQIKAKTVDFGASDDPMSGEDLTKNGLLQFPAVIGGVVAVVNLPGIQPGQLKIDGKVLADIFRGKITKWNDPAITAMNAGVTLSDTAITLVYRSDSSGTTAVFTDYLAGVSPEFKKDVGAGKTVTWASGVGGRGNAGVAASVTKVAGSIGYVEYAYAKQNKMTHMGMVNKAGKLVQPDDLTFAASAAKADW